MPQLRALLVAFRSSPAFLKLPYTRRTSSASRSIALSRAWGLRPLRRRILISSPPWGAPMTRSFLTGSASDASELADRLPSRHSRDYGLPFAKIFRRFRGDFYAIDRMLFSPAEVIVTAIDTGESFHQGHIDLNLLDASFA
jgi:hypothetical protein